MNAHVNARTFVTATEATPIDRDGAATALAKIRHVAEGLVDIGDHIVGAGDGRTGNIVAAMATIISELATEGEGALGYRHA